MKRKNDLFKTKVCIVYEALTDGVFLNRTPEKIAEIIKQLNVDMIFRGFFKWMVVVDNPNTIPNDLVRFFMDIYGLENESEVSELISRKGYYYDNVKRYISGIKAICPDVLIITGIPAQTVFRYEYDPITKKVLTINDTWGIALDPSKWGIRMNKTEFQAWWYSVHPYGGVQGEYDYKEAFAYFPDITNKKFQDFLVHLAIKQIECGADGIWIDLLFNQAIQLMGITRNPAHPAVLDSIKGAVEVVERIKEYSKKIGRNIYVGSWIRYGVPWLKSILKYNPP